jgi:hypothetical protein
LDPKSVKAPRTLGAQLSTEVPAAAVALPRAPRMMSREVRKKLVLRPRRSPKKPKKTWPRMLPMRAALLTLFLRSLVWAW